MGMKKRLGNILGDLLGREEGIKSSKFHQVQVRDSHTPLVRSSFPFCMPGRSTHNSPDFPHIHWSLVRWGQLEVLVWTDVLAYLRSLRYGHAHSLGNQTVLHEVSSKLSLLSSWTHCSLIPVNSKSSVSWFSSNFSLASCSIFCSGCFCPTDGPISLSCPGGRSILISLLSLQQQIQYRATMLSGQAFCSPWSTDLQGS